MFATTARVGLECGYRGWHYAAGARAVVPTQRDDSDCQFGPRHLRARARWNSRVPQAFLVASSEGRRVAAKQGAAPSLPLLHILHLQTEGGEAGQEVRHFIHLQGDSQADPGGITLGREHRHCPSSGHTNASPRDMSRMGLCCAQQSVTSEGPRHQPFSLWVHPGHHMVWYCPENRDMSTHQTLQLQGHRQRLGRSRWWQHYLGTVFLHTWVWLHWSRAGLAEAPAWSCGCSSPVLWYLSSGGGCRGHLAVLAVHAVPGAPGTPVACG